MTTDDEIRPDTVVSGPLTPVERQVLEFARLTWRYAGAKDAAIREWFGWSPTRFYAVLTVLLRRPEALAYDPVTVRRLQRLEEQRTRVRTVGTTGMQTHRDTRGVRPARF